MSTKAQQTKKTEQEVHNNYLYFAKHKKELMKEHEGEFVLIHNQQFVGFYATDNEAFDNGAKKYGIGNYSVQEITNRKEYIGIYGAVA